MSISMGKKGLSPIIATVLLISFAVALGAVVMNWRPQTSCESNVMLHVVKIKESNDLCYSASEKKIKIGIENVAKSDIDGVKITVFGKLDTYSEDFEVPIKKGEGKKISVNYDAIKYGEPVKVKVIPMFAQSQSGYEYCPESSEEIDGVDYC